LLLLHKNVESVLSVLVLVSPAVPETAFYQYCLKTKPPPFQPKLGAGRLQPGGLFSEQIGP
jgi:hypothetical protein